MTMLTMWISRSLRRKIFVGYVILVAVIAAVGVWAIYNVLELNKVLVDITKENYISVLAAENMIAAIERQDSGQLFMLTGEGERGRAICEAGRKEFAYWFEREANNITLPGEDELVTQVRDASERYDHLFTVLQSLMDAGQAAAARRLYFEEIQPVFGNIRGNLQSILRINDAEFMAGNARSGAKARQAALSVAAVAGSAVVFGVLFALALSKAVVKPTVRLTDAIRRIREGNLNETVAITSQDELGTLASEFNNMLSRLRDYENALHGRLAVEQQKALAIVRSMKDGVLLLDGNRRIVMLNPAASAILGIDGERAVGEPVSGTALRSAIGRRIEKVVGSGGEAAKDTVASKRGDAEAFYEIETVPFCIDAQEMGWVVILKDVTYFKLLEQKKAAFLASVAHELRTPLTSISMGVGILNEGGAKNAADGELLAIIQEETDRLRSLVDDLLELSRLDSGPRQLNLQPVSIAELLERAVAPFRLRAEANQVSLLTEVAENLPAVEWDADKIQSVVANLIDNALRYTEAGGTITVGARQRGSSIRLSVADSGPGIPADLQDRIFDSFYQIKGKPAGKAGLGLAICKAIVKRHGGKIWADSVEGRGATFRVELPIKAKTS